MTEWIPVSKRLPEKDDWYLISGVAYNGEIRVWTAHYMKDLPMEWDTCEGWNYTEVLAWMPLPEPYKEEQDE